ncbi:MAG TPA: phosphotransferase [Ktedonobacterales bacterium]|nr:phosphotransferase [Ktedonobacterales bacterium]
MTSLSSSIPNTPLDPDDCLRRLRARYPDLPIQRYMVFTNGWDSLALALDDTWLVRFARRPDVEAQLVVESHLLPALAPALPAPIPHFELIGDLGARGLTFAGYRLLPGVPLPATLAATPNHIPALARQIAAFLGALHAFPLERAAAAVAPLALPSEGAGAGPHRHYADLYEYVRARVFPLLDAPTQARAAAFWEPFLADDAYFAFRPALIHADLAGEHILCDPATGALTGIIDWGDARAGDPALDFTGLLRDAGPAFAEAALAAYPGPVDPAFRRRMDFYARLIPYHEVRFGLDTHQLDHLARGLAAIRAAE